MNRKLLNLLMMIIFLKVFISQTTYAQNAMQSDLFKHHIIAIDKDGKPRNPVDFKSIDDSLFINNIKKIIELKNSEQHKNKRLVIFIHGGLNSYGSTKQRVLNKTEIMLKDNVFPIFIAWNSAPVNSLGQHLFRVRDGEDWRIWGPVTAPLMLVSDLLTAVAKAPIAIPSMAVSDISTINKVRNHNIFFKNVDTIIKYNESLNEPNKFNIKDGSNTRYLWRNIRHFFQYTATFPLKTVGTPFVIAFGKPMWQIMERRTQTLFRRTSEFDLREINDEPDMVLNSLKYKPTGALAVAMNLINMAQADMPQNWNKIDVIAHSMGTMVCNQLLYYFPTFKINNIVYMGAACRISDFEAKTIPYLYKNIETTFYNLSLHPNAEKKEISAFEIGPRGSLLEWIDIFFNTSTSIKEKTLGKWLNIIQCSHIIPEDLRKRVYFKCFDSDIVREEQIPQRHGEFAKHRFWDKEFWW